MKLIAEYLFQKNLITEVYPKGIVSLVSDSFNFFDVVTKVIPALKDDIMARQPITDPEGNVIVPGKTVIRPDSGDPVDVICGTAAVIDIESGIDLEDVADEILGDIACKNQGFGEPGDYEVECYLRQDGKLYKATGEPFWNRHDKTYYYFDGMERVKVVEHELTPEEKGAVQCLWDVFGGTITDKGYKVLDEHIGLIYGDSITLDRAERILEGLKAKGFASCNVVFGIGSYTYQFNTRDTFGFAMKATYGEVNGEGREIFKDPITDSGTKKSAKGLLRVEKEDGEFVLYDQQTKEQETQGELQTVFLNGELIVEESFSDIRERLNQ